MTDDRFDYLCIFLDRIESEIYRHSVEIQQLSEYDFRTIPEAQLERAEKHLRSSAEYLEKKLNEMRQARTKRAA